MGYPRCRATEAVRIVHGKEALASTQESISAAGFLPGVAKAYMPDCGGSAEIVSIQGLENLPKNIGPGQWQFFGLD